MSKPKFSQKRRGKKVDLYPLSEKKTGSSKRTSRPSRGRPRKPVGRRFKLEIPGQEARWYELPEDANLETNVGQSDAIEELMDKIVVGKTKVYDEVGPDYLSSELGDPGYGGAYVYWGLPRPVGDRVHVPLYLRHVSSKHPTPPYGSRGQDYDHVSDLAWEQERPKIVRMLKKHYTKKELRHIKSKGWKVGEVTNTVSLEDKSYETETKIVFIAPNRTRRKRFKQNFIDMAEMRKRGHRALSRRVHLD